MGGTTWRCAAAAVAAVVAFGGVARAQQEPRPVVGDKEQPFALTISGGVSLGAYEAGLNWALVKVMRRAADSSGAEETCGAGGPTCLREARPVLIGATGASAGTINSLLTAITWCEVDSDGGITTNLFGRTWLDIGLDELLPEDTRAYGERDGVLATRAFEKAIDRVRAKLAPPKPGGRPRYRTDCDLQLGLTLTRTRPADIRIAGLSTPNQRYVVPLRVTVVGDRLQFAVQRFHKDAPRDRLGNILYLATKHRSGVLSTDQVIELVKTASAYPVAFARHDLTYCAAGEDVKLACEGGHAVKARDAGGLGCAHLPALPRPQVYHLCQAEFLDGGVFDNVPLGMATAQLEPGLDQGERPIEYIYIDTSNRRVPAAARVQSAGSQGPLGRASTTAANADFLGGAVATARNYELHNVLRYNAWNAHGAAHWFKEAERLLRRTNGKASMSIDALRDRLLSVRPPRPEWERASGACLAEGAYLSSSWVLRGDEEDKTRQLAATMRCLAQVDAASLADRQRREALVSVTADWFHWMAYSLLRGRARRDSSDTLRAIRLAGIARAADLPRLIGAFGPTAAEVRTALEPLEAHARAVTESAALHAVADLLSHHADRIRDTLPASPWDVSQQGDEVFFFEEPTVPSPTQSSIKAPAATGSNASAPTVGVRFKKGAGDLSTLTDAGRSFEDLLRGSRLSLLSDELDDRAGCATTALRLADEISQLGALPKAYQPIDGTRRVVKAAAAAAGLRVALTCVRSPVKVEDVDELVRRIDVRAQTAARDALAELDATAGLAGVIAGVRGQERVLQELMRGDRLGDLPAAEAIAREAGASSVKLERRLVVSRRFGPIASTYFANFSGFLDRSFREADYAAGIYDALHGMSVWRCTKELRSPSQEEIFDERELDLERDEVQECLGRTAMRLAYTLNLVRGGNTTGRIVRHLAHVEATYYHAEKHWGWTARFDEKSAKSNAERVVLALLEPERCASPTHACLEEGTFEQLAAQLGEKGFQGGSEFVKEAIHDPKGFTRSITVRRALRRQEAIEDAQEQRSGGVSAAIAVSELILNTEYERRREGWHTPSAVPDEAPGLLHQPIYATLHRGRGLDLGWQPVEFAFEDGVLAAIPTFTLRSWGRDDDDAHVGVGLAGAIRPPGFAWWFLSSMQAGARVEADSWRDDVVGEVSFTMFANFMRVSCGFDVGDSDDRYAAVGLNDVVGLIYWGVRTAK